MVHLHGWEIGAWLLAGGLSAHIMDLPIELFGRLQSMVVGFPRARDLRKRRSGGS